MVTIGMSNGNVNMSLKKCIMSMDTLPCVHCLLQCLHIRLSNPGSLLSFAMFNETFPMISETMCMSSENVSCLELLFAISMGTFVMPRDICNMSMETSRLKSLLSLPDMHLPCLWRLIV
jgi:hypothetical protein